MNPPCLLADLGDEAQVARLSDWARAWEPRYAVERPPRDALLYEPDGTLFSVALGDGMSITWNHRTRRLSKGDAIVVPQGLALEFEPEVDLLAIRWEGSPPDHFRERFIQVWGFDHFPAPRLAEDGCPGSFTDVITRYDPRFPISYAAGQLSNSAVVQRSSFPECDHELTLVINLAAERSLAIRIDSPAIEADIPCGHVLGLGPGLVWQPIEPGLAGSLSLCSEPLYHARQTLQASRSL